MGRLEDAVAVIGEFVNRFDPDLVDGERAARLVEVFTQGTRFCEAGRLAAAARVEHTHAWKRDGHRSPQEWYAAQTKTTASNATAALETAKRLPDQPALQGSLRSGRISSEQANEIAAAAHADPGAERSLVAEAERSSLKRTRKSCQAVRAAAAKDPVGDRQKVHASRYFAHWTSSDGAVEGKFRLTADHGAIVLAALERERQEVFAQARREGVHESSQAYLADAFVNLARNSLTDPPPPPGPAGSEPAGTTAAEHRGEPRADRRTDRSPYPSGGDLDDRHPDDRHPDDRHPDDRHPDDRHPDDRHPGITDRDARRPGAGEPGPPGAPPPGPRCPTCHHRPGPTRPPAVINVRVDHAALVRGHTNPGEICEIEGIGPVPVETVRAAASDAVLNALLIKEGRVIATTPAGRTIPAHLRRRLTERDRTCVVPGCDNQRHLEIHHLKPYAEGGATTEDNTARICPRHHDQITYGGAILSGGPGHWTWTPPATRAHPPPDAQGRGAMPTDDRHTRATPTDDRYTRATPTGDRDTRAAPTGGHHRGEDEQLTLQ